MVFNVEWGDGEEYETFNPDKAKQKAKDKGGKVFLSDDMKGRLKNDEQVYPDPNEFELPGIRKKKTKQGKITSLKVRLARLRLASELDDDPRLEDPAKRDLDKKRGSKKKTKKASKDPYSEYTKNTGGKRKKNNKLTRSDQKRGKKKKRDPLYDAAEAQTDWEPASEGDTRNARSDQKRGKKDKEKVRGSYNRTKRQEGSTQEYSGFGEYVKNTGDRRKKKNKLTRSDKKRP